MYQGNSTNWVALSTKDMTMPEQKFTENCINTFYLNMQTNDVSISWKPASKIEKVKIKFFDIQDKSLK